METMVVRRSLRGGGGRGGSVWVVVAAIMVVMLTCAEGREPVLHRVGGRGGRWTQNINYTEWAASEPPFYVGDWLYFGFDKRYFNVLEVNKTSYENCTDKDFIKNITQGGRDVFQLMEAKPYYFLSSGGYCYHGMRLAVNVQKFVPVPVPQVSPTKNGAPVDTSSWMALPSLLLTISLVLTILLNPQ